MSFPEVVSRAQWLDARTELLVREKRLTRERDSLNADRRRLPMMRVEKDYRFEGENGPARLLDMFGDCRQLVMYHAMFDPEWEKACPGCTAGLDETSPALLAHLKTRDTNYAVVARAPLPKIAAYKAEYGWTFPWYSSYGSDFNYDFGVTLDARVTPPEYNYRAWDAEGSSEMPGFSCFLRDGDAIFHTYSTFGRGTELTGDTYGLLDLTALGRQEDWEEPKGRGGDVRSAGPVFS